MKNFTKILGVIALVAIIGFSMSACGGDDGSSTSFGESLALSGQVYVESLDYNTGNIVYQNYNGNLTIVDTDGAGGSGAVTNGQLAYSIDAPNTEVMGLASVVWYYGLNSNSYGITLYAITVNPPATESYVISYLETDTGYDISKFNDNYSYSGNTVTYNSDSVLYVYVDREATISASGKSVEATDPYDGYPIQVTAGNLNLNLKAGWNTVRGQYGNAMTWNESTNEIENEVITVNYSVANPNLKWVYEDYSYYGSPNIQFYSDESNAPETLQDILNKYKVKSFGRAFGKK